MTRQHAHGAHNTPHTNVADDSESECDERVRDEQCPEHSAPLAEQFGDVELRVDRSDIPPLIIQHTQCARRFASLIVPKGLSGNKAFVDR
jgi:hypothetical protein